MESYQASLAVSRQTTGWLFAISICLHALVLCILLLSYHVQQLLVTKQLKQAVPTAQGTDKSTVIFKNPQAQSGTAQNQAADQQTQKQQQNQQANAATHKQDQVAADATTVQKSSKEQNKQDDEPHTSTISKTEIKESAQEKNDQHEQNQEDGTEQENQDSATLTQTVAKPTTSIVKTAVPLEPARSQHADSIPVQKEVTSNATSKPAEQAPAQRMRNAAAHAYQPNKTPWYKAASTQNYQQPSATRTYSQASAAKPAQTITLKDVTRGFLKSVQQEKQTLAQSQSQLSTHDMVSKSYETKVYNILQKSVLVEAKPINMHQALSTVAEVALTLDRTGKIVSFEFNHPLPRHVLKAAEDQFRRAAYSTGLYPSFPRIFTQNTYRFSLPLQIEITKGQHSYQLTSNYRSL